MDSKLMVTTHRPRGKRAGVLRLGAFQGLVFRLRRDGQILATVVADGV